MKLKSKADGFEFEAYHVAPKDARRGGLILVQEIFGVTPGIKELADSFAEEGYERATIRAVARRSDAAHPAVESTIRIVG